jgi:hypothetical protein
MYNNVRRNSWQLRLEKRFLPTTVDQGIRSTAKKFTKRHTRSSYVSHNRTPHEENLWIHWFLSLYRRFTVFLEEYDWLLQWSLFTRPDSLYHPCDYECHFTSHHTKLPHDEVIEACREGWNNTVNQRSLTESLIRLLEHVLKFNKFMFNIEY